MSRDKEVIVLMSSYNGAQYIEEQIKSILSQSSVKIKLLIRDDGSTDATTDILRKFMILDNCSIIFGDNIGAKDSFMWLINNAPDGNYYAFSDQDDIWEPNKLISAISKIENEDCVLYHGLAGRVDSNLNKITDKRYVPVNTFGASLLTSATGCTMVFTGKLMGKLQSYHPNYISMHDAWVYRVCYALGYKVYYDEVSHMKYRQHNNNVSGGQMTFWQKLKKLKKNAGVKYNVAKSIKECCWNDMSQDNKTTLEIFLESKHSFIGKCRFATKRQYKQNSRKTNIQNVVLIFLDLI